MCGLWSGKEDLRDNGDCGGREGSKFPLRCPRNSGRPVGALHFLQIHPLGLLDPSRKFGHPTRAVRC